MTIQEMHYDFKKKLNKLDSNNNRNLLIPEIDWALNEAIQLFISNSASPKTRNGKGFELNQRMVDDLYTLVVKDSIIQINSTIAELPNDYMFYISSKALMSNSKCSNVEAIVRIQQQDDEFESDPFTKSSFEWREVNGVFTSNGIKLYTDNTFDNTHLILSYIKRHPYVCYPSGFNNGQYKLPNGTILNKDVHCILPEHTHREIVDIAVAISSGDLGLQDTNLKYQKLQLNQ